MNEGLNGEPLAPMNKLAVAEGTARRMGIPEFDPEEFSEFMDKLDASEEEKLEYLQLLWGIALTFVDISFGIDSTQRVISSTRKLDAGHEIDSSPESRLVNFESYPKQFNRVATDKAAGKDRS